MSEVSRNQLLASLSPSIQEQFFPGLRLVDLAAGKVLHEAGQDIKYVYFPVDGLVSLSCVTLDGRSSEVAAIGDDGMVGISVLLGSPSTSIEAIVSCPGRAYRMPSRELSRGFDEDTGFRAMMLNYAQSLITQVGQTAVCNRHHSILQQLCRWLLLSMDRLHSRQLYVTQELIASRLGVRREGVTEAAGRLQRRGVIRYARGHITVVSRCGLEALCCECYAIQKQSAERINHCSSDDSSAFASGTR